MNRQKVMQERAKREARVQWSGLCAVCGMPGTDIAHIYPAGSHPDKSANTYNMVLLCRGHHNYGRDCLDFWIDDLGIRHHRLPGDRVEWLLDRVWTNRPVLLANIKHL